MNEEIIKLAEKCGFEIRLNSNGKPRICTTSRDDIHDEITAFYDAAIAEGRSEAQQDTFRLSWIAESMFTSEWNGVIDSGSKTHWGLRSSNRHIVGRMEGVDFRDALDKAIVTAPAPLSASKEPNSTSKD